MNRIIYSSLLSFLFLPLAFCQELSLKNILVDQYGYMPGGDKVCIIRNSATGGVNEQDFAPGTSYQVKRSADNSTVYSGSPVAWRDGQTHQQSGDKVWRFDFSSVTQKGDYYILDVEKNVRSATFKIDNSVYNPLFRSAFKFYYLQRCGIDKKADFATKWADGSCHTHQGQDKNCRSVLNPDDPTAEKELSGGWHDAGDYNKYVNFTFAPLHQLLSAYEEFPVYYTDDFGIPESGNGLPDLLDEVKYELDWLLKMQENDGGVLMKVSTNEWTALSPASADNPVRRYGPSAYSSTMSMASVFAHAAIVFGQTSGDQWKAYGQTLRNAALKAWAWCDGKPYSFYDNQGFLSANPEISEQDQFTRKAVAAIYLYKLTNNSEYASFVETSYGNLNPINWGYWYEFEETIEEALLTYTTLPGVPSGTVAAIRNSCKNSVNSNNTSYYPAYENGDDAYGAHMNDNNYTWNSNEFKAYIGTLFTMAADIGIDPGKEAGYRKATDNYLHFYHGINPLGLSFLSNTYDEGAENCVNEIYHAWFGDGTVYDNALSSPVGPPHGFVTCGINQYYQPDGAYTGPPISPPQNQPITKSYKDWNTSWPENSWQISEVGIYTQAAYLRLLAGAIRNNSSFIAVQPVSKEGSDGLKVRYIDRLNGLFEVEYPTSISLSALKVYDSQGKLIQSTPDPKTSGPGKVLVNLEGNPAGMYLVRLAGKGYYSQVKILK